MEQKNFSQQEFNNFILNNQVYGFFKNPIKLSSGRTSHFYANWRNVLEDVWLTDKLTDFIIAFINDLDLQPNCFYGVPEGATKIGIITQYKWAKQAQEFSKKSHSLSMGRGKPKEHGEVKDRLFVGLPKGKAIVIEDVTTTGASLIKTLINLREAGIEVDGVITLTDRMELTKESISVKKKIEKMGYNFYSMSSALEILPLAYKRLEPGEEIGKEIELEFEKYGIKELKIVKTMIDLLIEKIDEKQNPCVIGLDPFLEKIPLHLVKGNTLKDAADSIKRFNFQIIDTIYDLVPAVKLQIAFYEKYGAEGIRVFKECVDYAKTKGLIVIEDGKRNDISTTAKAYAQAHLGTVKVQDSEISPLDLDFLTINPYLGSDGIKPFVNVCKKNRKGIFILVKTSNPSSGEFQDRLVEINPDERELLRNCKIEAFDKTQLYHIVALEVNKIAQKYKGLKNYSPIGAVVGATYPNQVKAIRRIMPNSYFLVPGYGAQGGTAEDIMPCFNNDGYGAIINSSRGILYAYEKDNNPERFTESAREATKKMIHDIKETMKKNNKLPQSWRKENEKGTF